MTALFAACFQPLYTQQENTAAKIFMVEAAPGDGFNYPYFIFVPDNYKTGSKVTLIVQPNNTGSPNDTLEVHITDARIVATNKFYTGNWLARMMGMPLLVPVFPRPLSEWKIYTHALDRDAVIAEGAMKRLDLQLIAMISDARSKLRTMGIDTKEKVVMTGFSAAGTFVNRFSLIHPDIIRAYACGGINAMPVLPVDTISEKALPYPVGTADFDALFMKSFNFEAFASIPQFLFMGEDDTNDAVQFNDGYCDSDREIIYELLGQQMMPERWEKVCEYYRQSGIKATFKTYPGTGHKVSEEIKQDILLFLSGCLAGNE